MGSIKRDRSIPNYKVGWLDPDHYAEQKNAEHILIDLVHFTRSAKIDFIQIDRSRIIDRSISCPGKYSKSISWFSSDISGLIPN